MAHAANPQPSCGAMQRPPFARCQPSRDAEQDIGASGVVVLETDAAR
jgi:hypothetical protein